MILPENCCTEVDIIHVGDVLYFIDRVLPSFIGGEVRSFVDGDFKPMANIGLKYLEPQVDQAGPNMAQYYLQVNSYIVGLEQDGAGSCHFGQP